MSSSFLFNAALWAELDERVRKAKRVEAAIAYLGSGGAKLLPLRNGDRLVVDLILRSVRAGSTDPREVKKLLRRGVEVFSRASLHAKFLVIDRVVIAGSANISRHAKDDLDEAAILTDDPAVVRRARATLERLCTEPVRKDYLETCLREYKSPQFGGQPDGASRRRREIVQAKLWLIAGLRYVEVPEEEKPRAERAATKVRASVQAYERSEPYYLHYPAESKFFKRLRQGDWALHCFSASRGFDVWPPARYLGHAAYSRGNGRKRHILCFERPLDAAPVRWTDLRHTSLATRSLRSAKPRTIPIPNDTDADEILSLWDSRGRFRAGRK